MKYLRHLLKSLAALGDPIFVTPTVHRHLETLDRTICFLLSTSLVFVLAGVSLIMVLLIAISYWWGYPLQ